MKKKAGTADSVRILIVMAVCNGEKWLDEQLESIIRQMTSKDRLLISLDPSEDLSMSVVKNRADRDQRIFWKNGPGQGVQSNFESLLVWARDMMEENGYYPENTVICMSDQDDVWMKDKLEIIRREFSNPILKAMVHNSVVTDENLKPISQNTYFDDHKTGTSYLSNVIKNGFQGSAMAFQSTLLDRVLPFPDQIPMHDQWIGLNALKEGPVIWEDRPLMYYRRHEGNASSLQHSSLGKMVSWRLQIMKAMKERNREMESRK